MAQVITENEQKQLHRFQLIILWKLSLSNYYAFYTVVALYMNIWKIIEYSRVHINWLKQQKAHNFSYSQFKLFIFCYTFLNPLLIICVTTLILYHLFHTFWHWLNKHFTVFFNFRVIIPKLNHGLYELGFCSAINFLQARFQIWPKVFYWVEVGWVFWPV